MVGRMFFGLAARHARQLPGGSFCIFRYLSSESRKLKYSYTFEPFHKDLASQTYGQAIDEIASASPDRVGWILHSENRKVTFAQFKEDVDKVASGLLKTGLGYGDTVGLCGPNVYDWLIMFGACAKIGALTACLHPGSSAEELKTLLNKVTCKGIYFTDVVPAFKNFQSLVPEVQNGSPGNLKSTQIPSLHTVILTGQSSVPGALNFNDFHKVSVSETLSEAENKVKFDDPLTIIFTSGTTGAAKAAALTHHNFVNNSVVFMHKEKTVDDEISCVPLPLFHVFGLTFTMGLTVVRGVCCVLPSPSYSPKHVIEAISKHRCTQMAGSPTMFLDLARNPDFSKYDTSSLKMVLMGGNICTEELRTLVKKELGVEPLVGYGCTEATTVVTCLTKYDTPEKKLTTVGRPIPYTEIKIADPETGREVPIGKPGEVWIRGHHVFKEYVGDPEKTAEVITSCNWYKSGDLGVMDEEGYLSIIGRLKDLIIRGGENIHPIEIEIVIDQHPSVLECLIISVPDLRLGEEACAWVILKEGAKATEEEIKQFCEGKIADFKIPKYVLFETFIPKTIIGKAQKNILRKLATEKLKL